MTEAIVGWLVCACIVNWLEAEEHYPLHVRFALWVTAPLLVLGSVLGSVIEGLGHVIYKIYPRLGKYLVPLEALSLRDRRILRVRRLVRQAQRQQFPWWKRLMMHIHPS